MASQWFTAVALFVLIAVSIVLYTKPDAWCLQFMPSIPMAVGWSVNYVVGLMNVQFVESLSVDTVYHIVKWICTEILVVWVQAFFLIVCPGVWAQLPPRVNAGVEQNTDAAPAALAAPAAPAVHHVGIIEEIEVIATNSFPRFTHPDAPAALAGAAMHAPAMAAPVVSVPAAQPNSLEDAMEKVAAWRAARQR